MLPSLPIETESESEMLIGWYFIEEENGIRREGGEPEKALPNGVGICNLLKIFAGAGEIEDVVALEE